MNKVWLKHYPSGVPAEINPNEYPLADRAARIQLQPFAELDAYTSLGRTISYAEFDRDARDFAAWLQQSAKLQRGDRIAIMLPNVLQYPVALFGALRAGLTIVNTNPLYTAPEIYGGTTRSDPMMIKRVFDRQLMAGSRVGYMHQLLAGAGWTSVFMLPLVRQPTLIVAGSDDPIIPLANAKIMNRLLPNSALHIHDGGHVELIANAAEQARVIEEFRRNGLS